MPTAPQPPSHLDASSQIMFTTAMQLGIDCETFPDSQVILMQWQGLRWYSSGSRTSFQSAIGQTIADNKAFTKIFLNTAQAPTAKHMVVAKPDDLTLLASLRFPLVMKPSRGAHGKGVIVGIADSNEAAAAFAEAQTTVLFEELLSGTEYRVVCVDYHFIAAAYRKPAHVVGDGRHTVAQLIEQKNQHPWRKTGHSGMLSRIEPDAIMEQYLASRSIKLSDIPQINQEVILRQTANLSTGGEAWDVTAQVCVENQQLFEKIAKTCDLNVIGIDVMCDDLSLPLTQQPQAGIIEINKSPGLRMHHYPISGQPVMVADSIIAMAKRLAQKLA